MLNVGAMLASTAGGCRHPPLQAGDAAAPQEILHPYCREISGFYRDFPVFVACPLAKSMDFGKILTGAGVPADTSLLEQTEQNKGAITMRGIYTPVTDIRRKVFTEVARMAYEVNELSDYEKLMRELPSRSFPVRKISAQQHLPGESHHLRARPSGHGHVPASAG